MSKKNKLKRKISKSGTVKPADRRQASNTQKRDITSPDETFLILFDKKAKLFLSGLVLIYLILSSLKIHTSNIANWDIYFGKTKSESVIAGEPRFIRMDEWMVTTPGVLSQYKLGMPLKNEAMGAEYTPVIWGLPVKDLSTLLRPNLWPYFIFDEEHAFAFSWNFNILFCLVSTFLLFMLLTRNNFWLSVFGAFFIFFSSGVQWWSYTIGNFMIYLNGTFICFVYLLYKKNKWKLILPGFLLLLSVYGFMFNLYPPFQVPLVYLYLLLLFGFIWQRKNFSLIKQNLPFRLAVFSGVVIILGIFLYHYYNLVKDTYTIMLNTAYPGRRFSVGGDLVEGKFFADFLGIFMTDNQHVPKKWMNICEASSFLMIFPIIFYTIGYNYFKYKKADPVLLSLSLFVIVGTIYILIGFPAFFSRLSLISMSPSYRALPILGAGNAFLFICYLGNPQNGQTQKGFSWAEFGIITVGILIFALAAIKNMNKATENYFTPSQVNTAIILVTLVYLLTRYKHLRFTKQALLILLFIMNIPNIKANPLTKGLSAIHDNPLVKISKEIHDQDPEAKWVVFGNVRLPNILKSNGINMFNGVKLVPPIKDMRVLDPEGKYDSTYNRYAWISVGMYINWKDTLFFQKTYDDAYTIYMDPCSPKLKTLGVKYFVYDYQPEEAELRCLTKVGQAAGVLIYKRQDE